MIKNMQYFKRIYESRFILATLVKRDIVSRYRRSFFGVAWTLMTPLSTVAVIGLVYSVVFYTPIIDFIPFLFSGLTPWLLITSCAEGGTMAYISAEGFITQTKTPIEVFPLRAVLAGFINYFFMLIAYFIVYGILRPDAFSLNMLYIIPATLIVSLFCIGCGNLVAIINLYIRDYSYIQSILIQALFYVTPIIYSTDMLKARGFEGVYVYNPFYYMIDICRRAMLGESPALLSSWIISSSIALALFIISLYVLKRVGRKIVFKF